MRTNRKVLLFSPVIILFSILACENTAGPDQNGAPIYFNSFESPADTAGWQGYGHIEFRTDTPPDGENQSILVSGGCIVPHFQIDLLPVEEDCQVLLRCWGKNLLIGGGVGIGWGDNLHNSIGISVADTVWTAYESDTTLFCPAGQKLTLGIGAGGFVVSAILVDLVEIVRVE